MSENFDNINRELPIEIRFIELMTIGEGIKLYEKNLIKIVATAKTIGNTG